MEPFCELTGELLFVTVMNNGEFALKENFPGNSVWNNFNQ